MKLYWKEVFGKSRPIMTGSFLYDRIWEAVSNYTPEDLLEIIDFLDDINSKSQYDCSENDAVIDCEFGSEAVLVSFTPQEETSVVFYDILSGGVKQIPISNKDLREVLVRWHGFISNPPK